MSTYEETVIKLNQLIEQYPDVENALFHADEDWEKVSLYYDYPKEFWLKWGDNWNLKVSKMTITVDKTKNLDWIPEMFPNLVCLHLTGSAKIKSLLGLEKIANLKSLSLEKLSNWGNLSELKNIVNLRTLRIEVNSKNLKIDLNELPEGISVLYFGPNKLEDLLYTENLDFNRFKELSSLSVSASQLGDGSLIKLPSTLKHFSLYRNNSFKNLSMFSTLSEDCRIVIRSLHLSTMTMPKEFKNIKIFPHD
jgi:hypothetical protein